MSTCSFSGSENENIFHDKTYHAHAKNVNESKCVRVSKSTYDLQSVTVTEEDPCVIREMVIEDRVLDKVQEGKK